MYEVLIVSIYLDLLSTGVIFHNHLSLNQISQCWVKTKLYLHNIVHISITLSIGRYLAGLHLSHMFGKFNPLSIIPVKRTWKCLIIYNFHRCDKTCALQNNSLKNLFCLFVFPFGFWAHHTSSIILSVTNKFTLEKVLVQADFES